MNRYSSSAVFLVLLVSVACGRSSEAPPSSAPPTPPKATVTTKVFEPLYRAGKSVQGATESGVTFVKFGELLQGFSTEVSITKDHRLNEADKKLLALYEKALGQYSTSALLWKMKLDAGEEYFKGEIPVRFAGKTEEPIQLVIDTYHLPVADRRMPYTHSAYGAIPGDSPQRVWATAQATLQKATDMYYGR